MKKGKPVCFESLPPQFYKDRPSNQNKNKMRKLIKHSKDSSAIVKISPI